MTAEALVADLRARGITLRPDGEKLRCRPRAALTERDLSALRTHKADVLAVLQDRRSSRRRKALLCYACKGGNFWQSTRGTVICGICHPPAAPHLVAQWLDNECTGRGA